ncbi:MAG: hypothetical protein AMXMBFR13_45470 [Phycisphaerae bacterium]
MSVSGMRVVVVSVAFVACASTAAMGASLTSVGVLDPASPNSDLRALSSDDSYAVGSSRSASGVNVPIVWSMSDGLVALPNPSGANSLAHGVAVGIGSNTGNIMISGLHEGNLVHRFYKAPLNDLAGGSWVDTASAGGLGGTSNLRGGTSNVLRSDIGIADGRWYTSGRRNDTGRAARFRGDPNVGWDGTGVRSVESVSGYGVVVGRDNAAISNAYYEGPGQAFGTVPGGGGFRTDGFGISPSFGKSAVGDFDVQWIAGQNLSYSGGTQAQAFRWKRGEAAMELLGTLPGHTSSVAYTVADNGVTAGRSFISGGETAVIWDTSGTWDTTGTAQSIQDLLGAAGVDTSDWTRLVRAYALSDDGMTVAGFGVWAADGSTRGFVAVIPEPAALALLALGMPLLRRRRQ